MILLKNILEMHDLERQVTELRKKADDERTKKEAVRTHICFFYYETEF